MAIRPGRSDHKRTLQGGGFTLVELVAVVTCVGLLIAIVEPSLDASRERARMATCLGRLRDIGTASLAYAAEDPQSWAIPVHPLQYEQDPSTPSFIGAYEWGGKSGIGRDDYYNGTPGDPLNSRYGTRAGFGPATRPLNNYLYAHGFRDNLDPEFDPAGAALDTQMDLAALRCPSDNGPPGGGHCPDWLDYPQRSSFDHFGTSYAANLFMTASSSGGFMLSNSPYMRPLSQVPAPARTIFYEENIGRWAWAARTDWCNFLTGIDYGPADSIRGWHNKRWKYTRVFGDAHAELQQVYIDGTWDSAGYAEHYRSELVFSDPGQQTMFRCIIIRGDGWQKDTFPAPRVPTGLWHDGNGRPSNEGCVSP